MQAEFIANSILIRLNDLHKQIRPSKLQKLLYYKDHQEIITEDSFAKWDYGLVIPKVYEAFKPYGSDVITKPWSIGENYSFVNEQNDKFYAVLDRVILHYADLTDEELFDKICNHLTWTRSSMHRFISWDDFQEIFKKINYGD